MKKKLAIFPFNGNGVEALDCLNPEEYEFLGFIDDNHKQISSKHKVYSRDFLRKSEDLYLLAVPGSPTTYRQRRHTIASLGIDPKRFITLIHPKACIGCSVEVGDNCLIMAGVVLTSNARIGDHVCILPNSVVHHDSAIGPYTLIGSNVVVAGGVRVAENCYIGSGSNIKNNLTIGKGSLIGLGGNVVDSIPADTVVAGNPARHLKSYHYAE